MNNKKDQVNLLYIKWKGIKDEDNNMLIVKKCKYLSVKLLN